MIDWAVIGIVITLLVATSGGTWTIVWTIARNNRLIRMEISQGDDDLHDRINRVWERIGSHGERLTKVETVKESLADEIKSLRQSRHDHGNALQRLEAKLDRMDVSSDHRHV